MMTTLMQLPVSDTETDIERFSDEEHAVVVEWDGETATYSTFTRGYSETLYSGPSLEAARESLSLTDSEWDQLLSADVEYLDRA